MSAICRDNSKGHSSPLQKASQVEVFGSKNDGPLSTMNSLGRKGVSDSFCDIGEYLCYLLDENKFDEPTRNVIKRIISEFQRNAYEDMPEHAIMVHARIQWKLTSRRSSAA